MYDMLYYILYVELYMYTMEALPQEMNSCRAGKRRQKHGKTLTSTRGVSLGSPRATAILGTSIQNHSPVAGTLSGTKELGLSLSAAYCNHLLCEVVVAHAVSGSKELGLSLSAYCNH